MGDAENTAELIRAGAEQLFKPLQTLLDQLLGPAATEVGLSLKDSVKVWRFKRQTRLLQEVKRLVEQSSEDVKPVATRLFFPILEAASIEDDDEMQTRWAALLANEAVNGGSVHPSFVEILKQMTPADARLLDRLFDWCAAHPRQPIQWWMITVNKSQQEQDRDRESVGNLFRLGLIVSDYDIVDGHHPRFSVLAGQPQVYSTPELKEHDSLSSVAVRFVKACREPRKAEKGEVDS